MTNHGKVNKVEKLLVETKVLRDMQDTWLNNNWLYNQLDSMVEEIEIALNAVKVDGIEEAGYHLDEFLK